MRLSCGTDQGTYYTGLARNLGDQIRFEQFWRIRLAMEQRKYIIVPPSWIYGKSFKPPEGVVFHSSYYGLIATMDRWRRWALRYLKLCHGVAKGINEGDDLEIAATFKGKIENEQWQRRRYVEYGSRSGRTTWELKRFKNVDNHRWSCLPFNENPPTEVAYVYLNNDPVSALLD
ncbi:hypothetical protein DEU56DRAFT_754678 [Suillus clintonianus]|uniref:uncharacterized protein n=1 Tax=Suillus clintonianus TaxID=1904413 RepID=UPI001B87D61D|nr:uncharacterized protein DEU56DRAFT_754678 [Suillus clintonianus]KAG2142330.1 hypothetical protein DEU56DRAFT_754678 [Suillus clintonianus]